MPVFDFSDTPNEKKDPECTYEVFYSNESEATPEKPILILDNSPSVTALDNTKPGNIIPAEFLPIQVSVRRLSSKKKMEFFWQIS